MSREKQNAEIYKPMCEELFNGIERKYQEIAKVKAEREQFEQAIELLKKEYEKAKKMPYVQKPLAWALYQVWKKVDEMKGGAE